MRIFQSALNLFSPICIHTYIQKTIANRIRPPPRAINNPCTTPPIPALLRASIHRNPLCYSSCLLKSIQLRKEIKHRGEWIACTCGSFSGKGTRRDGGDPWLMVRESACRPLFGGFLFFRGDKETRRGWYRKKMIFRVSSVILKK